MIDWRTSYFDLCKEIEILDLRAYGLEQEARVTLNTVWTGEPPTDRTNYVHVPLDTALRRYEDVVNKLCAVQEVLRIKRVSKAKIEKVIGEFEGLEYKVAYMRDIKGLPLDIISNELGYSYSWIMKMSMKIKRLKEERRKKIS